MSFGRLEAVKPVLMTTLAGTMSENEKLKIFARFKRLPDHDRRNFDDMKKSNPSVPAAGPSDEPRQKTRSTTVIGADTIVKGDLSGEGSLRIDGKFEGTIDLPGSDVTVGETGQVTVDITAKLVTIEGYVKGEINGVERVIISKTGRVQGNLSSPRVVLEDGGQLSGRVDMNLTDVAKVAATAKFPVKATSVEKPDAPARKTA